MLTKESTKLLEFIDKKTNTNVGLKKDIRELFNFFDSIDYETKINSVSDISSSFQSISIDSPFVSETIKKEIKEFNNIKEINFSTNKSQITLNIYYSNEDITKFLNTIIHAICFMFNLSIHSVRSCTINFYLSNFTKYLDPNKNYFNGEFNENEVNSGSASSDTINIWRKEEILKVTIHECMHLLNYDDKMNDNLLKKYYRDRYNVTSNSMNIYEAYTEVWAELINAYFTSKFYKASKTLFAKFIEYEKYFSNIQSQKIFFYKNLNENNDLNKHTNIVPYYIIKCEIFNNLSKFLNHCKKNNINYVKIKEDFNDFLYEETEKCMKQKGFFKGVNKNSYIFSTMRMSSIELELFKH